MHFKMYFYFPSKMSFILKYMDFEPQHYYAVFLNRDSTLRLKMFPAQLMMKMGPCGMWPVPSTTRPLTTSQYWLWERMGHMGWRLTKRWLCRWKKRPIKVTWQNHFSSFHNKTKLWENRSTEENSSAHQRLSTRFKRWISFQVVEYRQECSSWLCMFWLAYPAGRRRMS